MEINKKLVTKKAKQNMIDIHSEKYIKAWLDVNQYTTKVEELEKDYNMISTEVKERVEAFINQRLANPEGKMIPENDLAIAVSVKLGLDSSNQNLKQALSEFEFYGQIIQQIETI